MIRAELFAQAERRSHSALAVTVSNFTIEPANGEEIVDAMLWHP